MPGFLGSSATYGDRLAAAGFADTKVLTAITAAWDRTLALVNPNLVVADYAPAAMLASRGRLPLAVVGNGFTVPPAEMQTFPLLHTVSPPLRPEAEILGAVNAVLQARKAPMLDRLPQMLSCNIRSVQTFPILDIYREQRVVPVDGPILSLPEQRRPDARAIFAYIADGRAIRRDVFDALIPLGARLHVFGPGLTAKQVGELSNAGAIVEARPLHLESELAAARLLIHFGGLGVASAALAAGVPQLVLSVDIEKELNGRALERAGVGRLANIQDPATNISVSLVAELAEDDQVSARAFARAEDCRIQMRHLDPLGDFETQCLGLLN